MLVSVGEYISLLSYSIDSYNLKLKATLNARLTVDSFYDNHGMCCVPLTSVSDGIDDAPRNGDFCQIVLFGGKSDFSKSLKWLTVSLGSNGLSKIGANKSKQELFQQFAFIDANQYHSFGYIVCQTFLILFGGLLNSTESKAIFVFDFDKMVWYESSRVKLIQICDLLLSVIECQRKYIVNIRNAFVFEFCRLCQNQRNIIQYIQ